MSGTIGQTIVSDCLWNGLKPSRATPVPIAKPEILGVLGCCGKLYFLGDVGETIFFYEQCRLGLNKRVHCHTTLSLSDVCAPITREVLAHSWPWWGNYIVNVWKRPETSLIELKIKDFHMLNHLSHPINKRFHKVLDLTQYPVRWTGSIPKAWSYVHYSNNLIPQRLFFRE